MSKIPELKYLSKNPKGLSVDDFTRKNFVNKFTFYVTNSKTKETQQLQLGFIPENKTYFMKTTLPNLGREHMLGNKIKEAKEKLKQILINTYGLKEKEERVIKKENKLVLEDFPQVQKNKYILKMNISGMDFNEMDWIKESLKEYLDKNNCVFYEEEENRLQDFMNDYTPKEVKVKDNIRLKKYIIEKINDFIKDNNLKVKHKRDLENIFIESELDFNVSDFDENIQIKLIGNDLDAGEIYEEYFFENENLDRDTTIEFFENLIFDEEENYKDFFSLITIEAKSYNDPNEYKNFNFIFNINEKDSEKIKEKEADIIIFLEGELKDLFGYEYVTLSLYKEKEIEFIDEDGDEEVAKNTKLINSETYVFNTMMENSNESLEKIKEEFLSQSGLKGKDLKNIKDETENPEYY